MFNGIGFGIKPKEKRKIEIEELDNGYLIKAFNPPTLTLGAVMNGDELSEDASELIAKEIKNMQKTYCAKNIGEVQEHINRFFGKEITGKEQVPDSLPEEI